MLQIADISEVKEFKERYGGVYEKSDRLFGFLLRIGVQQQFVCWCIYQCSVALAFTANRFTVLFNDVSLAVTRNTDHFNLLKESAYGATERASLPDLFYTPVL